MALRAMNIEYAKINDGPAKRIRVTVEASKEGWAVSDADSWISSMVYHFDTRGRYLASEIR